MDEIDLYIGVESSEALDRRGEDHRDLAERSYGIRADYDLREI